MKAFLESTGAVVVAIRFDLIEHPDVLRKSLDSVDGVLFTGGFLQIRKYSELPAVSLQYYKTAAAILRYAIDHKLPLLGIC